VGGAPERERERERKIVEVVAASIDDATFHIARASDTVSLSQVCQMTDTRLSQTRVCSTSVARQNPNPPTNPPKSNSSNNNNKRGNVIGFFAFWFLIPDLVVDDVVDDRRGVMTRRRSRGEGKNQEEAVHRKRTNKLRVVKSAGLS